MYYLIYATCVGATAVGGGFYTEYTLPPALATNFNCSGEEARLYECQFEKMSGTNSYNCIHDAAVICQGNLNHSTSSLVVPEMQLVMSAEGHCPG